MNDHHTLDTTIWDDAWKKNIAGTKFKDMPGFGTFKKGKISLKTMVLMCCIKIQKLKTLKFKSS